MSPDVLDRLLEAGVVVLDGGLGTELERRGSDLSDPLWSARLLAEDPEAIVATHLAYFRAGAQVATTASYQATFEGFAARGIGTDEAAAADAHERRPGERGPPPLRRRARRSTTRRAPPACSSPRRSGRTARCWPTARSTAATTA